jgi:hypothetical protein
MVFGRVGIIAEVSMKIARNIVVGAVVAAGLAASAGLALAVTPTLHTLNVTMPDGGTAVIQYSGDVPPKVSFKDDPVAAAFPMGDPLAADPAFADIRKMSAAMDREMSDLMSRMTAPGATLKAGFGAAPGDRGYTVISTGSNKGAYCSRSIEVTQGPGDKQPKVVTRTEGNCQALDAAPARPAPSGQTL